MPHRERVNISPMAREFHANGVNPYAPFPTVPVFQPKDEASEFYERNVKPELYALFAVFIDRVVGSEGQKDTFAASLDPRYPFQDMGTKLTDTFTTKAGTVRQEVESGDETPEFASVVLRLERLLELRADILSDSSVTEADKSIHGGIRTNMSVMTGILELVDVLGKNESAGEKLRIAANTYPLIVAWASMHTDDFLPQMGLLQIQAGSKRGQLPFRPSLFKIVSSEKKRKVVLSDKGRALVPELKEEEEQEVSGVEVGCPALVNFGGGSAIRRLWDWHLDIAERVWNK